MPCAQFIWRTHSTSLEAQEAIWVNRDLIFISSFQPSLSVNAQPLLRHGEDRSTWLLNKRVQLLGPCSSMEWFPLRTFCSYIPICIYSSREDLYQYLTGPRRSSCCTKVGSRNSCVFICFGVPKGLEVY